MASRGHPSLLAPSLTTSWKASHRFNLSRSDSADGHRELSLGRAADSWRTPEAWNHHSERTVSRHLRGHPTTRSQTWRTFLANTFGTQTFISPMMFEDADDEETRVDASDEAPRPAQSIDVSRQSIHGRTRDLAHSRRPSTLGIGLAQRHPRTGARMSNCRDPPRDLHRGQPRGVCIGLFCLMRINLTSHRNRRQCEEISRTHARLLQLQLPLDDEQSVMSSTSSDA